MNDRLLPGRQFYASSLMLIAGCALGATAQASNGFNLVGFGAESLGLGSADIAVARDSSAVNINPAGLTQIERRRFDGSLVPYYSFGVSHEDALNPDTDVDNPLGLLTNGSYAQQALHPDLHFGLGLFVAGGTGVQYEDLQTVFGTRDEYSAVLGVTKLATGLGWRVSDRLSLGLGLNLSYSQARQKVFPETSVPGFNGLRLDGADGVSFNGRVGLQYRPMPTLTLALTYASETKLNLENGTLTVNYGESGLGKVKYREASVDGFALAQELGAGFAWQFTPRWMLAAEVNWLDWSSALRDATLRASQPDNPNAAAKVEIVQRLDHDDQFVFGVGLAHDWDDKTVLRVGVNIGESPIPGATLTPTLNLTADYEFAFGFTRRLDKGWEFGTALQIQPHKTEEYNNVEQPFGPAREDYGVLAWTLQLSRSW